MGTFGQLLRHLPNRIGIAGYSRPPGVIIGEECHIVSSKPVGPRWTQDFSNDFDGYENLILLCANDHTIVDAAPDSFPADKLHESKRRHEDWVRETLRKDVTAFANEKYDIESLGRITSGRQIVEILSGSHAYHFDYPDPVDRDEMELLSGFFQSMQNWGDILSDLEAGDHIRIGFEMNQELLELQELGLGLFGSCRKMKARFAFGNDTKEPIDWHVATLVAVRPDNPSVFGDFMIAGFPKKTSLA